MWYPHNIIVFIQINFLLLSNQRRQNILQLHDCTSALDMKLTNKTSISWLNDIFVDIAELPTVLSPLESFFIAKNKE